MTNNNDQIKQKCLHEKNIHQVCDEFEDIRQENMFYIFSCHHIMNHAFWWIEKQVILRSSCFSEHRREESMMCLCSLSIDKNYRSHTFLNLTDEVWSQEKWVKTWVLIDSECKPMSTIDTKYMQKQHLQTWKLEHNMFLRNFNEKIIWITYLVIMKLWFNKHVEHVELYVHDLKNKYDMIFRFQ